MGTYKSIRIMADTQNQEEVNEIFKFLEACNAHYCWNQFCESTKWWPDDVINKLRVLFPKVMFRLDYDGIQTQPEFFLGEQAVEAHWVLPYFPSKSKFNSGVKARKKYREETKKASDAADAARKAKLAADKEAQERKQLEELKLKYG